MNDGDLNIDQSNYYFDHNRAALIILKLSNVSSVCCLVIRSYHDPSLTSRSLYSLRSGIKCFVLGNGVNLTVRWKFAFGRL